MAYIEIIFQIATGLTFSLFAYRIIGKEPVNPQKLQKWKTGMAILRVVGPVLLTVGIIAIIAKFIGAPI